MKALFGVPRAVADLADPFVRLKVDATLAGDGFWGVGISYRDKSGKSRGSSRSTAHIGRSELAVTVRADVPLEDINLVITYDAPETPRSRPRLRIHEVKVTSQNHPF